MKYVASYHDTEVIDTTGKTTNSEWFDISWANELYSYAKFEESETSGNTESIAIILERFLPHSMTAVKVLDHGDMAAPGTSEKHAYYPDEKLGMRVRWKYVSSGGFGTSPANVVTITMSLYAKRN